MLPEREWLLKGSAHAIATDMSQLNRRFFSSKGVEKDKSSLCFQTLTNLCKKKFYACSQRKLQIMKNYCTKNK